MELGRIVHVETDNIISGFSPDIFIAASGYESRATAIAEMLKDVPARKIVLSYKELNRDLNRPQNDLFFKKAGFQSFTFSGQEIPDFKAVFGQINTRRLNILLDISCMTRRWYHSLLQYLHTSMAGLDKLQLRVVYIPSEFVDSKNQGKFKKMATLCPERNGKDSRKIALLLGISQDEIDSARIVEHFSPENLYLLYSDPAPDKRITEKTFVNNHELISSISIRNLIAYPIDNGQKIYQLLSDLALMLRLDHKLVVVPQGPKIFSLVAMALQLSYPDIDVCYPVIKYKKVIDRKPFGKPIVLDLKFENE